jgi:hypothetical protein
MSGMRKAVGRWLGTQPMLLTQALSAMNWSARAAQRMRTPRGALLALALGAVVPAAVTATVIVGASTSTFGWLLEHASILSGVAGVHALLAIARRRVEVSLRHMRSWLVAVPQSASALRIGYGVEVLGPLAAQLTGAVCITAILGLAAGAPIEGCLALVAWLAGGAAVGAAIGARWPVARSDERSADSRYVPKVRGVVSVPSFGGLSGWSVRQAVAWHRPENSRFLFIMAALSVPAGSSAWLGIAIVAFWTLASYMTTLLAAVMRVGREASIWLRATPVKFAPFAWAMIGRALIHQVVGSALVGTTLAFAGTPIGTVVQLASAWLAIVLVVSTVSLADAFRARPSAARLAVYVTATIVAEYRAHGWAFPLAVVIALINASGAVRSEGRAHVRS